MRWRWPPENWCGNLRTSAPSRPTDASSAATRAGACAAAAIRPCSQQRLGDDVADAPARVEAGIRILEDHLHAPAQRARGVRRARRASPARRRRSTQALPRVGVSSPTISRASVLLPQPDSPTSASVRPRAIVKLTSSTALELRGPRGAAGGPSTACASRRSCRQRARLDHDRAGGGWPLGRARADGRSCARALDDGPPAGGARALHERQLGPLVAAARARLRAARMEGAAGRDLAQPRQRALDLRQPLARVGQRRAPTPSGPRCRDAPGGGSPRRTGPISTTRPAYITATRSQVSAITPMSCVMSITEAPCACVTPRSSADDLRLHRDVERGGRLVRDDQPRLAGQRERDHHALAHAARELVRVLRQPRLGRRAGRSRAAARSRARAPARR